MKKLTSLLSATVAVASLTALLTSCQNKPAEATLPTFQYQGNPLVRTAFTSDPAPIIVGDTLYLLTGHDECFEDSVGFEGKYGYNITNWLLYSTTDMKTWTDHGVIFRPTDFPYGIGEAWASQIIQKDGKFYYFASLQAGEPYNSKVVGVAVADQVTGPYKAFERPLITDDMTDNGPRGWWNDIDPSPLIDREGNPWLVWGNGTCFLAKLNQDMNSLADSIMVVDLPGFVEGPWLLDQGGHYYIIYVSQGQGRENISYAMADQLAGPWTPMGEITGMPKNSFTIHPGVCQFQGQWYFFYHNGTLELNGHKGGSGRRSVCVEKMEFRPDGTICPIEQTQQGILK